MKGGEFKILQKQFGFILLMMVLFVGCFNDETEETELEEETEIREEEAVEEEETGVEEEETDQADGSSQNPFLMTEGEVYQGDLVDYEFTLARTVNYRFEVEPGTNYRVTVFDLETNVDRDYWLSLRVTDGPYADNRVDDGRVTSDDEEISLVVSTEREVLDFTIQTSITDASFKYSIMIEKE